jgi:hypothetical protein
VKEDIADNKKLELIIEPRIERIAIYNYEKQQHYRQKVTI